MKNDVKSRGILEKYKSHQSIVQFDMTIAGEDEIVSGFVIGLSPEFVFIRVVDDFSLDGFAIFNKDAINSARSNRSDKTFWRILRSEGLLNEGIDCPFPLKLTSWSDIFKTLKKNDYHVSVQYEDEEFVGFVIGAIVSVRQKSVSIHNYDVNGKLNESPTKRSYDSIDIVKFGDRYSTIFRKYLKK